MVCPRVVDNVTDYIAVELRLYLLVQRRVGACPLGLYLAALLAGRQPHPGYYVVKVLGQSGGAQLLSLKLIPSVAFDGPWLAQAQEVHVVRRRSRALEFERLHRAGDNDGCCSPPRALWKDRGSLSRIGPR